MTRLPPPLIIFLLIAAWLAATGAEATEFPRTAAFRSSKVNLVKDPYEAETGLSGFDPSACQDADTGFVTQDGSGTEPGCGDVRVDLDHPVVLDGSYIDDAFLAAAEAAHGDGVLTLQQLSLALLRYKEDVLGSGGLADDVYPGHWLLEARADVGAVDSATETDGSQADAMDLALTADGATALQTAVDDGQWAMLFTAPGGASDFDGATEHVQLTTDPWQDGAGDWWITVDRPDAADKGIHRHDWSAEAELVLAPHPWLWSVDYWLLNITASSPSGTPGLAVSTCSGACTGAEFVAGVLIDTLVASGADGFELDGARGTLLAETGQAPDADNDGVADWGVLGGVDTWADGAAEVLGLVRAALPDAVLAADGGAVEYQWRTFDHVDGIEFENLPGSSWDQGISGARELAEVWRDAADHDADGTSNADAGRLNATLLMNKEASATFPCHPGESDVAPHGGADDGNVRLGLVVALLTDATHTFSGEVEVDAAEAGSTWTEGDYLCFRAHTWDEYTGGATDTPDHAWLGEPLPAPHPFAGAVQDESDLGAATDLVADWSWAPAATTSAADACCAADSACCYTLDTGAGDQTLRVDALPDEGRLSGGAVFPDVDAVSLVASSSTPVALDAAGFITLRFTAAAPEQRAVHGGVHVGRPLRVQLVSDAEKATHIVLVPEDATDFSLTFQLAGTTVDEVRFKSGGDAGSLEVQGAELLPGSGERWLRYFQGGVAALNGSGGAWTTTLDSTRGPQGYHALVGAQDPSTNTGLPLGGGTARELTIPAGDAQLVEATSWATSGRPLPGDTWGTGPFTGGVCPGGLGGRMVVGALSLSPGATPAVLDGAALTCRSLGQDGAPVAGTDFDRVAFDHGAGTTVGTSEGAVADVPVGVQLTRSAAGVTDLALITSDPLSILREDTSAETAQGAALGRGGAVLALSCSPGDVLVGLQLATTATGPGSRITGARVVCTDLARAGDTVSGGF